MECVQLTQRGTFAQAFKPARKAAGRQVVVTRCIAEQESRIQRRSALQLGAIAAVAPFLAAPAALAEKVPKGYVAVKDAQDGYSFLYPFGWQEVSIDGQDVVFKDVIEPLESVSVSLLATEKKSITEFGDVKEVSYTLADKVLTSPSQEVTLVNVEERTGADGRKYYDFEFKVQTPNYIRHAAASVTVANGNFYTLVTGSNEKRWGKMEEKVKNVVKSFNAFDRFATS